MCEQLGKGKKPMRKLLLHIYGGHTAYHDAKAHARLTQTHKVGIEKVWGSTVLQSTRYASTVSGATHYSLL